MFPSSIPAVISITFGIFDRNFKSLHKASNAESCYLSSADFAPFLPPFFFLSIFYYLGVILPLLSVVKVAEAMIC
jgi:hypothetical protein